MAEVHVAFMFFYEAKPRPNIHTPPSNETMKPTAPLRNNFSMLPRHPAVAYLFLVRS
jgi:hypothetical protein